jgi:hypothetical protein
LLGSLERFTVAIIEVTAAQMRGVLIAEGVFKNAATSDSETLNTLWRVRQSPEYQDALHSIAASGSATVGDEFGSHE